jgi:hypothetical protein
MILKTLWGLYPWIVLFIYSMLCLFYFTLEYFLGKICKLPESEYSNIILLLYLHIISALLFSMLYPVF